MIETNKQALIFKFGGDLSYFVILRYKLRDFIKNYDYVNGPIKGDFEKTLLLFHIGRKSWVVECKWLWLHTTRESLLGLSFMINNQTV